MSIDLTPLLILIGIYLTPLLILIGLIVYFIIRASIRASREKGEKGVKVQIFLSKEDIVSQFFFLFSVSFLGVTLLAFNKDLGEPLTWRTILLITSVIGVVIAYYFKVIYTLAVSLIGLAGWWGAQAVEWSQGKDIKETVLFSGLLFIYTIFYLLGRAHEKEIKFKRVSIVYSILGLIPITGALFFLSTKYGLEVLEDITQGTSFFSSWEITLSLFIFLIFLVGILVYTLSKNLVFKSEAAAIGFLVVLFCVIALIPEQTMFLQISFCSYLGQNYLDRNDYACFTGTGLSPTGILWAFFFNVLIFLELVGIIFLGYLKRENWLINLGLFFIFTLIFVKYFDWFHPLLDKSIFFIGTGILLFVVGWFMERRRRYLHLLSTIKKRGVSQNQ